MTDEENVRAVGLLVAIQALSIQVEGLISGEAKVCEHPLSMLSKKPGMTMGKGSMELVCECGAGVSMSREDWAAMQGTSEQE